MSKEKPWFIKGSKEPIPPDILEQHQKPSAETLRLFESFNKKMDEFKQDVKSEFAEIKQMLRDHIEDENALHADHDKRIKDVEIWKASMEGKIYIIVGIASIAGSVVIPLLVDFLKK